MRKEILLAIILGIAAGLGLTLVLYTVRQRFGGNRTPSAIEESRQKSASPSPTSASSLSIQQPTNNLLTSEATVRIVGRALPQSYIIILTPNNEFFTTADQDGDFAQEVELQTGANLITVNSTTPEGQQETVSLSVVYSTVNLDGEVASSTATLAPSPSPSPATRTRATATPTPRPAL